MRFTIRHFVGVVRLSQLTGYRVTLMPSAEAYLKPEVIRTVSRLDLRARFIVEGFLSGLHASPFHGFSVEFSEHRRYSQGDDPKDIDWLVYAKTDRYYIKKYQAETNITGYLLMDLSESMAYTYRQELTKFEYSICLAAALAYLMVHQQDPVGLMTFDEKNPRLAAGEEQTLPVGEHPGLLAKAQADRPDRDRPKPPAIRRDGEAQEPGDALQRPAD